MEVKYGKAGVEQEVRRLSQPSGWAKCEAKIRVVAIDILKSWKCELFCQEVLVSKEACLQFYR